MTTETTAITASKQEVRLQEWTAQIEAQQASGLTVQQWCTENGINLKTYNYRLKKVREQFLDSSSSIVPLSVLQQNADIRIEKNGLQISHCRQIFHRIRFWLWYNRYAERSACGPAGIPGDRIYRFPAFN